MSVIRDLSSAYSGSKSMRGKDCDVLVVLVAVEEVVFLTVTLEVMVSERVSAAGLNVSSMSARGTGAEVSGSGIDALRARDGTDHMHERGVSILVYTEAVEELARAESHCDMCERISRGRGKERERERGSPHMSEMEMRCS